MSQIKSLNISDSDLNVSKINPDVSIGQYYWKGKNESEREKKKREKEREQDRKKERMILMSPKRVMRGEKERYI